MVMVKRKIDPNESLNLKFSQFQPIPPINQKNFYTEYLKNDNQYFANRQIAENAKKAAQMKKAKLAEKGSTDDGRTGVVAKTTGANDDSDDEDEEDTGERAALGSKTIVLHLGSSNTRLGLASDPHPKSVPTVLARKVPYSQQKRPLVPPGTMCGPGMFGEEYEGHIKKLESDMRARMRNAKRRMVPNANDLVSSYNKRSEYEEIVDHNDLERFDWTDVSSGPVYITGKAALRIPTDSSPHYDLFWPIQNGVLHERAYQAREQLLGDLGIIISQAVQTELGIAKNSFSDYSVALVVPDLYDKAFVESLFVIFFRDLKFSNALVLQESVCATFGAGISSACVVDVGAQSTTISCVEEGLCIGDSRISMTYGGDDLTKFMAKQLLRVSFPYRDFDLSRAYDVLLAEDLKLKFCSSNEAEAAVQLYQTFQRQPGRQTRKYNFKVYDEHITCTMAYFHPEIFENDDKYSARRSLFSRSMDIYEDQSQEPESVIQDRLLYGKSDREPNNIYNVNIRPQEVVTVRGARALALAAADSTRADTPLDVDSPMVDAVHDSKNDVEMAIDELDKEVDAVNDVLDRNDELPLLVPLDVAIISSITCACENAPNADERRKAMCSTILISGAGYNFPYASYYLEERLKALRPAWTSIAIVPPPRDMQPEMLCWKGLSIFSRIKIATEYWVSSAEFDLLGSRTLQQKSLGQFWLG
ncbi:protein of unknown function [Taphrina deformans PYCC 5710]|uniref:Uncharacterized protein n=1 Tax=Taphrina deformans (strain PYCC 5710 / ATCC 11124 / CBS 356.35 / IMI 108563 / JCM 9778 / NBRC 8474) TaxID=1097556 RepID=R4XH91_TAPDE|nr:protein of unknown function [Taphrina deformans PYCC 5710]|eukprot:CCG83898.1 protein of unknown function [Taphrina deformans PYCC 5710]